ncbi:tRNA pseudouridine(38-40) synthase TruA [Haliea sp.]
MAEQSEGRIFSTDPLPPGTRIACRVEYDGSAYNGWQAQPHPGSVTVQQTLEAALSEIAAAPLRVHCAGRTDSGVHAHAQVIHFDAPTARSRKAWVIGSNSCLPPDIRVHWAQPVSEDFHARFSALARRYRYVIANTAIRPALLGRQLSWQRYPLDIGRMHAAARFLLGEQDFSAFRAASCQSSTPYRCVDHCEVTRRGDLVVIDIQANAFLHHMVRNIAGSLMAVGIGSREPVWIEELLAGQDRTRAADTASATGLYLVDVVYPERFDLPATSPGPLLLGT